MYRVVVIESKYGHLIWEVTFFPCLCGVRNMGPYSEMVYNGYVVVPD